MKKTRITILSVLLAAVTCLVGLTLAPAPASAENCILKWRWVDDGCCGPHRQVKQQEEVCCEFTGCHGWSDTGATKCDGVC